MFVTSAAAHITKVGGLPKPLLSLLSKESIDLLTNFNRPRKLHETLSRMPNDGVGARVHQTRWSSKGIEGCYWEISRVKLRREGTRGDVWGRLVWRGKPINEKEQKIPGALKYMWAAGESKGQNLRAVLPPSPLPVSEQLKTQVVQELNI